MRRIQIKIGILEKKEDRAQCSVQWWAKAMSVVKKENNSTAQRNDPRKFGINRRRRS